MLLSAVEGRVTLPPEEGRLLRWLGEPGPLSVRGDKDDVPQAFSDDLLPQLSVPFGTISTFGSRPWFSNLWLGKLIGFGTATFPNIVMPLLLVVPHLRSPVVLEVIIKAATRSNYTT